ncbi:PriCT-2 domain-containing protein [Chelatococcus daeguensis]|uniref:PriCT-2 domain-containing protein n=1 Tax=Chelatococcus daeguensis TaxID=444444 RepID=UPI000B23424F|nr:PriCT-2 domain-containing protein [Chelatococcus daeguensis]MBM3083299.1 PriCT-2 domain-containing protein [Chelatococcus daeguensis]
MEDAIRTTEDMARAETAADASTSTPAPAAAEDPTDLRLALHRNGYRPVPVLGAHVAMKAAGKRPMMKGWETVCASADEAEIARWARAQRNCTNTGLLCGDLVGVDIDVLDVNLADRLRDLALAMLGPTPLLRIGKAPKCLLAFRTDAPFDKVQTSEFQMLDGTVARVEVLASGQQFVAFGIHPGTRAPYHWPDRSPLEVPLTDLPIVSRDTCAAFIAAAEEALRKAGGQTSNEKRDIDREGRKVAGLKPKEAPSQDLIAEAIAHIPNNDLPYDDWIKVGLALYAALGPDGRALWEAWSAEAAKNDPAHTAQKWDSFATVRNVTVGTLFWLARQNGWRAERVDRVRTARASSPDGQDADDDDGDGRPVIRIFAGFLHRAVDMAEGALIQAGLGYYQRGSMVVRPAMVPVAVSDGRTVDAHRLVDVKAHHMAEAFTRAANWKRFDKREGEWLRTDCPHRIAETFLAREGQWRLPVLTGIINCPTLRPDGSILDLPGYDAQTGLLFDPQEVRFPALPRDPDQATALRALAFLKDLISTFPFVTDADRSVALSGILTALIRRSLPTAPLHGFNAPTAGTGKSMLVDLASQIATARPAPVIAQGKSEEEMEKRLGAALIAGDVLIAIDNCEKPLGGELLCQTLTQTSLKVRILGKSVNAEVPSNAAVFATGNNLTLEDDMTRRAIRATLDAGVERPELRAFDRDPLAMVTAQRGDYVAAGLTVLRAYHIAGRPEMRAPLGSFTDWSRWVRDALIWLGEADPCDTMEGMRGADPKLEALTTVLEQWREAIGMDRVTVREVIERATEQRPQLYGRSEFIHPEFREAPCAWRAKAARSTAGGSASGSAGSRTGS